MRRSIFSLCLATVCLGAVIARGQSNQSNASLPAALADLNSGKILDAIDKLKQIARKETDSGPAYYFLSRIYTEMGELNAAEGYLNRAITADPNRGEYYYQSGMIRQRQKKSREALALFERALSLGVGRDEAAVWRNIGNVRAQLFEREGALEAYQASLRIQPNDVRTRLAVGQFLLDKDEPQKAVVHLRAAVDLDPKLPGALASLGLAYRRLGDTASAAATLKRALELVPTDQDSRYSLGQVLLSMGQLEEGRKELQSYQRVTEQVSQADRNYDAATTHIAAGKYAEAQKLLEETLTLAPAYSPALRELGNVLLERGKAREAAEVFKRAVTLNPVSAAIHFGLGAAYFRTNNLTDAAEETRRALLLDEDNARYHRQMGEIYLKLGRTDEGRAEIKTAAQLESR
jgi:tetratricopeptide (TPR) repeat protein